ncbi:MAG: UDP-N-acetylmuramoyl-tripeptide--D-alanyl-D-alanine ligase [Phycisphaerales bacterium]|nr:UDP-N-acetylmuramoyl-tripeptide--D-alanyl-D-alanine ligase [Phycisphaerales bacterium]
MPELRPKYLRRELATMPEMMATLAELAQAAGGACRGPSEGSVTGVFHDTRSPLAGGLYIALRGPVHDGHEHLEAALKAGASAVLVDRPCPGLEGVAAIEVPDTKAALLELARWWRGRLSGTRVIGVTGTAGKTTTKDLLQAIGNASGSAFASPRSFNNDIGVPLTILGARRGDDMLVAEVGTSSPGEIGPLASLLKPHVAVITCIGAGHLDALGTIEGVRQEKYDLARAASEQVIIAHQGLDLPEVDVPVMTFGDNEAADAVVSINVASQRVRVSGTSWPMVLQGRHGAMNIAAAVLAAKACGCDDTAISTGLHAANITQGRFTVFETGTAQVIDDTWNSNPLSAAAALDSTEATAGKMPVALVLGEMKELGELSAAAHGELVDRVAALRNRVQVVAVAWVGHAFVPLVEPTQDTIVLPEASEAAMDEAAAHVAGERRVVLVKGSRSLRLERVVQRLRADSDVRGARRTMSH